jgi:trehalose 6-phosphate phosphatase
MARRSVQPEIDSFLQSVARASRALLMLDYDGTLAPFHRQRHQAFPYPGIASLLERLVQTGHTRVVIVSGRDANEMLLLLGMQPSLELWGLHGLQRRRPDGAQEVVQLAASLLDALSDADRWLGYQQLRQTAEFKTGSVAVHWRGLSNQEAEEIRARVLLGWRPIAERSGLALLDFDGGVEIRAAEINKGDVVRTLLAEIGPAVPAAYLGDDTTDEPAFLAIRDRGLSVLVRPQWRSTAAQGWLKPPDELQKFLQRWLEACRARQDGRESAAASLR